MTALSVSATVSQGRRQLVNVRERSLLTAKARLLWVAGGFGLLAAGALMRIAYVGVVEPAPASRSLADALTPARGDIVDRRGVPLARAFPAYALWYNPGAMGEGSPLVHSPRQVAEALVRIFPDMDVDQLTARLASGKPGYLRRRVLPEDANRIHDLGEPGLEFPRENERYYPQGSMAAHVLGFVGADGKGRVGMEQVFDEALTDPARRSTPQALSIDTRVQGALEDELGRGMAETNAKGAAGIILDVDTGEVLALASLPSFNPNLIDDAGKWIERKDVRNVRVMVDKGGMRLFNNEWMTVTGKHLGPELGIGHVLGHAIEAPVLVLKSCIGNRSLGWDLLPPGSEPYEHQGKTVPGYRGTPENPKGDGRKPEGVWWNTRQLPLRGLA